MLVDPQLRAVGQNAVFVAENLLRELVGEPLRPFAYQLPFYFLSLGRRDGLIQWGDDGGRPVGRVLTGARGAWFKEFVCRSTWWSLAREARGRGNPWWPRALAFAEAPPTASVAEAGRGDAPRPHMEHLPRERSFV